MHWHQDEGDLGKRKGLDPITVAILSMDGFDAMTVDPNDGRTESALHRLGG